MSHLQLREDFESLNFKLQSLVMSRLCHVDAEKQTKKPPSVSGLSDGGGADAEASRPKDVMWIKLNFYSIEMGRKTPNSMKTTLYWQSDSSS